MSTTLPILRQQIRHCQECAAHLPHAPRPVLSASHDARLLIIGQAPGAKVHASGIAWQDASGNRLREWLGLDEAQFYNENLVAILPMGFCYPGKALSGDLPPRRECAPKWHAQVLDQLPNISLTLLVGQYAQKHYLKDKPKTLTETVRHWQDYMPRYFPLPHPSPRNQIWLRKNPWFEAEVLAPLRRAVQRTITDSQS